MNRQKQTRSTGVHESMATVVALLDGQKISIATPHLPTRDEVAQMLRRLEPGLDFVYGGPRCRSSTDIYLCRKRRRWKSDKETVRITPNPQLSQFLEKAKARVASMPAWERGILQATSQATNPVERKPIIDGVQYAVDPSDEA